MLSRYTAESTGTSGRPAAIAIPIPPIIRFFPVLSVVMGGQKRIPGTGRYRVTCTTAPIAIRVIRMDAQETTSLFRFRFETGCCE